MKKKILEWQIFLLTIVHHSKRKVICKKNSKKNSFLRSLWFCGACVASHMAKNIPDRQQCVGFRKSQKCAKSLHPSLQLSSNKNIIKRIEDNCFRIFYFILCFVIPIRAEHEIIFWSLEIKQKWSVKTELLIIYVAI